VATDGGSSRRGVGRYRAPPLHHRLRQRLAYSFGADHRGASGQPVRFDLAADGAGHWTRDGKRVSDVDGALDVDLGFTPATNTLPIQRLKLAVGASAPVTSAWLRFPELHLERLEQTYTRESERSYRYRAVVDGEPFTALLETDDVGRVLRYGNLWASE
jgi:hypothetical protein